MKSEITDERILWEKRSHYNPLVGLRPQTLRTAIDAFDVGYISRAARIWEKIEDSDGTLLTVRPKRRKRVSRLKWDIIPLATVSEDTAKQHASVLEDFYNNISWTHACDSHRVGGFSRLVEAMLDCVGKKYSVHEIIWKPNPTQRNLRALFKFVPLYFFENTTNKMRLLKSPNAIYGEDLKHGKWLITATDSPLMTASSVFHLMMQMSLSDWLVFSRRFGSALACMQTNEPFGTDKWLELNDMMANIDNESGLLIGKDDTLQLLQVSGQNAPMPAIIDKIERKLITMWAGSDLATLSSQDGAGASLQGESGDALEDDDCLLIEETLAETVSRFVIRYYFGNVEPAAYLQFKRTDNSDKKAALELLSMSADRGVNVSKSVWRETAGIVEPKDGEEVIEKSINPTQPIPSEFGVNEKEDHDVNDFSRAISTNKKQKLLAELDRIEALSDASERIDAFKKLRNELGDYFNEADVEADAMFEIIERRLKNEK